MIIILNLLIYLTTYLLVCKVSLSPRRFSFYHLPNNKKIGQSLSYHLPFAEITWFMTRSTDENEQQTNKKHKFSEEGRKKKVK